MYFMKKYKNLFFCASNVEISPQEMANISTYLINVGLKVYNASFYLMHLDECHFLFARLESGRGKES